MFDLGDGAALTLLEEADAPGLFDLVDRNRDRLRVWLGWTDGTRSETDSLAFIRTTREQWERGQGFNGCLRVRGRIAGCVGLHGIDRSHLSTAIGYWIGAVPRRDSLRRGERPESRHPGAAGLPSGGDPPGSREGGGAPTRHRGLRVSRDRPARAPGAP